MKRSHLWMILVPALVLGIPRASLAAEPCADCGEAQTGWNGFELDGFFKTYAIWKNDSDFDSKAPIFNAYGQSVGFVAGVLSPKITWRMTDAITLRYWPEITGSLWSRTVADPNLEAVHDQPVLLHKELWARVALPGGRTSIEVGFQELNDPTLLYLKGYDGAVRVDHRWESDWIAFTAAEIPDTVYEGTTFEENNFSNDNFLFALSGFLSAVQDWNVTPALYVQWDRTIVDKTKVLATPAVSLESKWGEELRVVLDLVLQAGQWSNSSIGNRDTTIVAGAVQAHAWWKLPEVDLEGNFLVFSPDDGDPNNGTDTGFQYSGYARSRTLVLSENDLFDQYDNLDEKAAASNAGLLLVDLTAGWNFAEGFQLFDTLGCGTVLESRFANGGTLLGVEEDLGLSWKIYEPLEVKVIGGVVVPGRAGGALQNDLGDLAATDPMYYFQGALILHL